MLEQGPANKGENPAMPSTSEWQASRGIDPAANKEAREASSSHIAAGSAEELFGGTEDNTDSNRMEYLTLSELTDLYVDANDILAGGEDNAEAQATQEAVEAEAERRYDYIKATAGEDAAEEFMDNWDSIISPEDDSDTEVETPQDTPSPTRRGNRGGRARQDAEDANRRRGGENTANNSEADLDAASQEAVDELNLESPDTSGADLDKTIEDASAALNNPGVQDPQEIHELEAVLAAAESERDRRLGGGEERPSHEDHPMYNEIDPKNSTNEALQARLDEAKKAKEEAENDSMAEAAQVVIDITENELNDRDPNRATSIPTPDLPGPKSKAASEQGTSEEVDEKGNPKYWNPNNLDAQQAAANMFNTMARGNDRVAGGREKLTPDGNWNPNNSDAQQAAANMFDIMAGGSKEGPDKPEQIEIRDEEFRNAQFEFVKAATDVRLSHSAKKGGRLRGLLSKLPFVGKKFAAEEDDSKVKAMQEAKEKLNKIVNENGIAVAINERNRLKAEGKTDEEISKYIKGLSALGDLRHQESITWDMNEMAKNERKTSGFLGRWFNDLDKEGNAKGSNKFVKFMKKAASVGIVAGGAGAAIGFGLAFTPFVGAAGLAVNIIGGAGATVMGSKIGKNIARSGYMQQNRTKGSDDDSFKQSIDENGFRNLGFGISNEVKLEQESNTKLVNTAKKIGELTALLGFMGGNIAGNLLESYINNPFKGWSQAQMDAFARMVQGPEQFQQYSNMVNSGVYSPKEIGNILDLSWKMMGSPANPGFSGYTSSLLDKLIQPLLTNNISTTLGWTTAGPNVLNVTNALVNGSLVAA